MTDSVAEARRKLAERAARLGEGNGSGLAAVPNGERSPIQPDGTRVPSGHAVMVSAHHEAGAVPLGLRLLDTEQLLHLPPPTWLVDHVVPDDAVTLLYGPSGAGKSHVAVDIAAHVATGSWWHGREVKAGQVLYVIAESPAGLGPRVAAWQAHHRLSLGEHYGIDWLPVAVNLFDLAAAGELRQLVDLHTYRLVVIDTLARCSIGVEENSAKDMGRIVEQVDGIRRAAHCSVLLVHHTGKAMEAGARGSSALKAAVDAELEVTGSDDRVTVRVTKQRNAPEALPIHFKLTPSADSVVLLPARGGVDGLPAAAMETLEALVAIDVPGGVSATTWKASAPATERTFYRHRAGLLADGLVVNLGPDSSPRYRPASSIEDTR